MNNDMVEIVLRKAREEDREKLIWVESKSTPNLSYVAHVFDMFLSDEIGELSVAEANGEVVACAKYTVAPDGSAWLETLRVIPARQGIGIGKRFYERFFELSRERDVTTMRMYTGVNGFVSKGLAERFGFRLRAMYRGAFLPCQPGMTPDSTGEFQQVTDPERATALLMPFYEKWTGFWVMNRTFFSLTPALCADIAQKGLLYEAPTSGSVITLGARFMPEQALHIGVFGGDVEACLGFALQKGLDLGVERLSCLFPPSSTDVQDDLIEYGFQLEASDFIVMEVHL